MDFKIFYYTLSCILSRTYMCNVCAYVRMEIAAAKVRKIFDIYKCICENLSFLLILQGKWEVLRAKSGWIGKIITIISRL